MNEIERLTLEIRGDARGSLIAIESSFTIPFEIKRAYYIFGTSENVVRGKHAHKNLSQIMICVCGSCEVIIDNGKAREVHTLNHPTHGILIQAPVWREMQNFSHDCVLLVLADKHYDPSDYIHDYKEFLRLKNSEGTE